MDNSRSVSDRFMCRWMFGKSRPFFETSGTGMGTGTLSALGGGGGQEWGQALYLFS